MENSSTQSKIEKLKSLLETIQANRSTTKHSIAKTQRTASQSQNQPIQQNQISMESASSVTQTVSKPAVEKIDVLPLNPNQVSEIVKQPPQIETLSLSLLIQRSLSLRPR